MQTCRIQPAFRCPLLALFGHDTRGVGPVAQGNGEHFFGCGHFEVQRQARRRHDPFNIGIANMTSVLA